MIQLGTKVKFHVVETDLGDRPTGKEYDEVGVVEYLERDIDGCLFVKIRVSQSRFYVLDAEGHDFDIIE